MIIYNISKEDVKGEETFKHPPKMNLITHFNSTFSEAKKDVSSWEMYFQGLLNVLH